MGDFVEAANEVNRVQVLAPTKFVGNPLPWLAAKIEIEHGRYSVNAQPVEVILFEPKERAADQEVAYFVAPKVENLGAPVLMFTLARIRVLIEMGAIEVGK